MVQDYYEVSTPPVSAPITLSDAKAWCRITHSSEDSIITGLIDTATLQLEAYTNRVFSPRTFTGYFSSLDVALIGVNYLTLRRAPLIELSSLKAEGGELDEDSYSVQQRSGFAKIIFNDLPVVENPTEYPFEAIFTAGYTTVPSDIKTAIKQLVCLLYQGRGDCEIVPKGIKTIVSHYRVFNTFG